MESRRRWKVSCIFFFKAARKGKYIWIERRVSTCGKRSAFLCCFARQKHRRMCCHNQSEGKGERRFCLRVGWWVGPFSLWVSPSKAKGSRLSKNQCPIILSYFGKGERGGRGTAKYQRGGPGFVCSPPTALQSPTRADVATLPVPCWSSLPPSSHPCTPPGSPARVPRATLRRLRPPPRRGALSSPRRAPP